jgi:hypothetical protein
VNDPERPPADLRAALWKWRYLIALGAFAVFGSLFAVLGGSSDYDPDTPTDTDARFACRQFVEDRLKAPATADFTDETVTSLGGERFEVTGSVESQNSFGTTMRSDYECDLRYNGDERWTLTVCSGSRAPVELMRAWPADRPTCWRGAGVHS